MAFVVASTAVGELVRGRACAARVAAVLPAAVYLEIPGTSGPPGVRLALLARDAVRVPIGLITAVPRCRRPFDGLRAGDEGEIGGGALQLAGVEYRPLRYWDPGVPRLCGALAAAPVPRRAEALALLAGRLPAADVSAWSAQAGPLESALRPVLPDAGRVAEAVAALAGLGPGLTPAGDDVLAGALVTLAAAADVARLRPLAHAVRAVLPRTTPVSAALLDQACQGRAAPEVGAVLRALAGSGDLDAALGRLAAVGHTSGAALALGMRTALRARSGRTLARCA